MAELRVGTRVMYGDRRGTVCFVGALHSSEHPGIFAGICWDESQPGLHDGVFRGIRYFQCRPSSGSFIPMSKLNQGETIIAALMEKYGTPADTHLGVSFGNKEVLAVGWEKVMKKISNLERLTLVDLTGLNVCIPMPLKDDLSQLIPNVRSLGLGRSLIGCWSTVMSLIQSLPRLDALDLSDNRLAFDVDLHSSPANSRVKKLVLRKNVLVWEDVIRISEMFPRLEELYLSENCIHSCGNPAVVGNNFSTLKLIDLDSQSPPIADWNALDPLGRCVSLESLQLSGNNIGEISFSGTSAGSKTDLFSNLTHLTIKLNALKTWSSVDELNKLKTLENLKITGNSFLDSESPETARQWIVAKIANLKMLNQSPISTSERRDSELDYMRHFAREYLSCSGNDERRSLFLSRHPRFLDIVARLGPLEQDEVIPASAIQLTPAPLTVTLQHHDCQHQKTIPPTISVMKLKRIFQRLFREPLEVAQVLAYKTPSQPGVEFVLDDDQKEIAHYDLRSGDTIFLKSGNERVPVVF
ncbi:tubulin-specific chaperone E-like [Paramacrobiotus metropolitanus]|uniref:tubulin-specific chaperone E-like n=1 Tax=Paramacrobiotus metropolitanus TaxID=2943436 RepID=UPI002445BD9A|nr:tubulin-specific chaperone E-like [Paramacrobiotus metropolitanus]